MKESTKKLLIASAILIIFGIILAGVGFISGARSGLYWEGGKLFVQEKNNFIEYSNMEIGEFKNLNINSNNANVYIIKSNNYGIEYSYNDKFYDPKYNIENGTLTYTENYKNIISFFNFDFNFKENFVKIYVPSDVDLSDIKIENKNGKVSIDDINTANLDIDGHNGAMYLNKIKADNIKIYSRNGALATNNITTNTFSAELKNGRFEGDNITANNIKSDNRNGATVLSNLNTNSSEIKAYNGKIDLSGYIKGNNTIENNNGSTYIKSSLSFNDYSYKVKNYNGHIKINGQKYDDSYNSSDSANNTLDVISRNGGIDIVF